MKNNNSTNRRRFLKAGAAGVTAMSAGLVMPRTSSGELNAAFEWTDRSPVNPNIDNLKVVCCYDPLMAKKDCAEVSNWPAMVNQNSADVVDRDAVRANLDAMAMKLADKKTAAEAWGTIFRKPSAKTWGEVKVAIKVNGAVDEHPRIAILEKLCHVLHDLTGSGKGVKYGNIIVYDGCHNAIEEYAPFVGPDNLPSGYAGAYLPAGVVVSDGNNSLGGVQKENLPPPYTQVSQVDCTKHIADGTIDILINCAVCKGHHFAETQMTMCMKNHFGTFTPNLKPHGNVDYQVSVNRTNAILGGTPIRQQLCIIDALWAMTHGAAGVPNKNTYRLIMGTFAPAVDYLTVKKIREDVMGATHNASQVAKLVTGFGYKESEMGDLTIVSPATGVTDGSLSKGRQQSQRMVFVTLDSRSREVCTARIRVPLNETISRVSIVSPTGRSIRDLYPSESLSQQSIRLFWDGRDNAGKKVAPGSYVAAIASNGKKYAAAIAVRK